MIAEADKRILHVMLDEKFNDMAIRMFESAGAGVNDYRVASPRLVFTKSPLARTCSPEELIQEVARPEVSGVVFHGLPPVHHRLLLRIPQDKCVVWIGWGYDYYYLLRDENEESRILEKTRALAIPPLKVRVRRLARSIINRLRRTGIRTEDCLKRVDYFSPVLDVEYDMVRRHVPLRAQYIAWNYGTAEDDFALPGMGLSSGGNILAGNSASATNNHIELFESIRDQVDLSGRKVIVPLSYGDPCYRDRVIAAGNRILGESFYPLTEFMSKDQYLETIRSCGFVAMNHLRQQALGNICMAILMGAKIYLNEGNPLTSWLRQRGAIFGSMDALDMQALSADAQEHNRTLLLAHWGREAQQFKTRRLMDVLLEKNVDD